MECQMRRYHKNSNGFTMAEMLITVAIIVILCGFGFVAVIAHQRNLKRMEMDETAQEIFIAAQNHLTAARASGQWSSFLEKTAAGGQGGSCGTAMTYQPSDYNKAADADAAGRKFYYFTTESAAVKNGAEALILPEGSIDETLRGHHFYVEYDAASGTVFGVFYTDSDHEITAVDAQEVSRTEPNARRDYKADGKRTIIGYYGGALGELNNPGDLYAPSVAVRNAESLVLYVVDKNYYRPVSSKTGAQNFKTKLKLTFEGVTSGKKAVKEVDPSNLSSQTDAFSSAVLAEKSAGTFDVVIPSSGASAQQKQPVNAEYYAIVLDSIVRKDGHFADLFPEFIPGEDIRITVTLTSDKVGEDVSQTVTVNSMFNSVKTEKNGITASKTVVTVSNPRHLENLSSEVSGVDFAEKRIVKDTTVDTVSVVRNLFWDEDAEAEKGEAANERVTAFIPAIISATGMTSKYGYNAGGAKDAAAITKENLQVYPYSASGTENAANSSGNSASTPAGEGGNLITKGSCYGITNTAIKTFEGNNHILAAFRYEGKQNAALINEAADGLTVSDLLIADVSAVVTGESADGSGAEETPAAAVLLAKAKSGSIENIAVRWYEGGTNQSVTLPAGRNVAAGMQGCRVYAEKGIASALIGSVDAKQAGSTTGSLEISNVSIRTVVKTASAEGKKATAHLGIEGETTAVLLGKIKSGAVTLDNSSKQSEEDRKSYVCMEGTLSLKSDKGQENAQASGGLIGRISGGDNALVKQLDFTAGRMEMGTEGGVAGGLVGVISGGQKAELEGVSLSANSLDVTGKTAAGGAVGNVSAGELSLNKINILTTKENKQDYGEAGQENNGTEKPYGIRVTAENGTAGGLLGTASSAVTELTITEDAVSGSGTADQVKAGSSAGGLIGDTKASNTTITSSAASLYIRSEGNGGNVGGSSSTDGAGGLVGSASGNVTITNSYSGGRTTNASDPDEEKSDASTKQARYVNAEEGQGRYNVYLASGSGAAGGLLGKFNGTTGSLKIENSYSTSSVAVPYSSGSTGAAAGGLVGDAGTTTLTANNTYCTGRVYANGAQNGTTVGTATGSTAGSTTGGTSGSTAGTSTPNYGTYAGKLGGITGTGNYYLKGMNGVPSDAVGTLGVKTSDITIAENVLTGANYYDDNCALKKGVDTAQKSYYFDTALAATKYPFMTVTTAIARPVSDPDTGIRNPDAEDGTNKFAQIGDWEIPKEEASAEGAYGLIYYERIWDGTTNKLDPTFYYHGYMLESGETAETATYREVHSKAAFVTDKEKYVSESGYLLLVRKEQEKNDYVCIAANTGNIDEWGQISEKVTSLPSYPLESLDAQTKKLFAGYSAYNVSLSVDQYRDKTWLFTPKGADQFGGLIAIREKDEYNNWKKSKVAFTYAPFFADALKAAELGKLQSVSKSSGEGEPQAVIRSADQMQYFFAFENALPNTGYLVQSNVSRVIEQQLDITFNHLKVTFTQNGQPATDGAYQSPTLKQIGWANATYRSKLRPNAENDKDFYVLDGLRAELVTTVYGELCDLQITDIKAPYFIQKIELGAAKVHTITITDACFAKGENYDQATSAGFVEKLSDGTIEDCHIINADIYGNGFINSSTNQAKVNNCTIVNAIIWKNGFIQSNGGSITNCGIYADPFLYSKDIVSNYRPYGNSNGTYDYVSIGIAPGGTRSIDPVAGFMQEQTVGNQIIQSCYVAGTVYGAADVSGFIGKAQSDLTVENCYANVLIDAGGNVGGFASEIFNTSTKLTNCHALGVIKNAKKASGFVRQIHDGAVNGCYEAFWNVHADEWYPFYEIKSSSQTIQNNYYLTDYALSVENEELVDYSTHAKGLTYQQLHDFSLEGQNDQAYTTVGYYQYMNKDDDHKIYPYPMPAGMTAYGDWSYEDPDRYTLLYYEKVNGEYYFHGYSTEDGESYTELATSGDNVQLGLVAAADQRAEDDGYILIAGTNSSWSTFGRADNSGTVSSPVNNANTQVFKPVASSDTELLKALENLRALKKKNTDKIYIFQPEQYLNYADATKNFAAWRTLTQESEGIGISVYSTKGAIPMAKFSFQPFFADTVKQPNVVSQGTSNRSEISFVTTKDEDPDYDYRIRSLRQLQALSDWDAGIWNKKENVADAQTLKQEFDQKTRRYSYLSTSSENYENHLKIRQDLDINVGGANISFARIDGTYVGKKYDNRSVMLQELRYDFAKQIASTGKICSLVIDQAKLDGLATTSETSGDIAHGGQKEFVEYNYGSISDITVQNSKLGSAGLVYQNGNASKDALKKEIYEPQEGAWGTYVEKLHLGNEYKNAYRYEITIHYLEDTNAEIGSIQNCIITNSKISGAGIVWKNIGGSITDSCVQNCVSDNGIGHAGFVEYNQATVINNVPETRTEYVYLLNERWNKENQQKVPEEIVQQRQQANQNGWFMNSDSQKQISVFGNATIKNCFVSDCNIRGNGFVGENSIYTQGNNSGGQAKISNCQVYGTSSYSDMKIGSPSGASDVNKVAGFVGNNGKGAEIENCSVTGQVGGRKNVAGFVLTNAGTITGSYANTKIACEENQGTMLSGFVLTNTGTIDRSHSLGEESCKQVSSGADNQAAGFVVNNQKTSDSSTNAVIRNSYAAMWKLELNGTEYVPFGSKDSSSGAGSYDNCYAMKLSAGDGYSGTYLAASAPGITYVSGEDLQKKCNDDLGNAAEDGKTTAYQAELKSTKYPFPCGSMIMNYGDWKLTDGNSAATHTITLAAGCKAVFPEDVVRSLSADAAVMAASDDGNTENADEAAITGTENAYGQDSIPEEDRHEVQLELGEEEETLDLAELVPVRKGWKLLGWLITAPSELTASTEKITVSDIVTKVTKVSDGSAEAEDADAQNTENAAAGAGDSEETEVPKAIYQLEMGNKSYHFAPDAVITVTEDMTLSAVWVPDDDTVEKAKDGTLRMDENGNILDGEEQVTNDVMNETTETDSDASAADTSSAVTGDDTDGMTEENQDASTDQTADASGTLPAQNTKDDMSEMSDLTGESDPEMETSPETTGEEGDPAGE